VVYLHQSIIASSATSRIASHRIIGSMRSLSLLQQTVGLCLGAVWLLGSQQSSVRVQAFTFPAAAFRRPRTATADTAGVIGSGPTITDGRTAADSRKSTTYTAHTTLLQSTNSNSDTTATSTSTSSTTSPQVWSAGYSTKTDLVEALEEAVAMAVASLPVLTEQDQLSLNNQIDVAVVSISSLYDGGKHNPVHTVIPVVTDAAAALYGPIQHLVGCSSAGVISSSATTTTSSGTSSIGGNGSQSRGPKSACRAVEWEGLPAVSVTLGIVPDTTIATFACSPEDVPDDLAHVSNADWKRAVGLSQFPNMALASKDTDTDTTSSTPTPTTSTSDPPPVFMLFPSTAFSTILDDLIQGMNIYYPGAQIAGGLASTVSSLSRAVLYRYSANSGTSVTADGCVGLAMTGDVQLQTLTAQGAKPVGGIYQILKGKASTIQAIVLDETATAALRDENEEEAEEEEEEEEIDIDEDDPAAIRERRTQAYAKARIPKPVLAEANFLMRTLSDDDQAFMRRQLLVGLDNGGSVGRTASELARLAQGKGHRFTVYQVASAGMKDGSVSLPQGRVDIQPGTRMRFFVRESDFAKKEVEALWVGYKKKVLDRQFASNESTPAFQPAAVFVVPTLDRGSKFFQGKSGYETSVVTSMIPGLPCISGFFSNGVVGRIDSGDSEEAGDIKTGIHGSSSGYFLIGSRTGRPIYSPAGIASEQAALKAQEAQQEVEALALAAEDEERSNSSSKAPSDMNKSAPRSEDGELILKRREVHSGRSLTVSTVEWSVAENTAVPSCTLEGFMWDKETEVDRFRERVPLANLVSQSRLSVVDPNAVKPRDWVGPLKRAAAADGRFVIIPQCKRMEPISGSLWKRYDPSKLAREFTLAGAPVISVNCDAVLFGGSLEDVTKVREASTAAAIEKMSEDGVVVPPILASDLLLYPYQLYKLQLAGADAVNLFGGALAAKDLMYLAKIASSLKIQTLVTVTSEVQLRGLTVLPPGTLDGVIVSNRELEVSSDNVFPLDDYTVVANA
jgi:indole-3-glycerol phosphate synthase